MRASKSGGARNLSFVEKTRVAEGRHCERPLNQPAIPSRANLFGRMLKGSDEGVYLLSEYMAAKGRKGGQIGGKRRLKIMTADA
jgi:hypothetical protein